VESEQAIIFLTIRPATVADADLLTDLAALTMREAFGPPHNPAELVEEYVASAITQPILETELADPQSWFFLLQGYQSGFPLVTPNSADTRHPAGCRPCTDAMPSKFSVSTSGRIRQGTDRADN
jgi:hypothetical protein